MMGEIPPVSARKPDTPIASKGTNNVNYGLTFEDWQELQEEPPGGENHGRVASGDPQEEGEHLPLNTRDMQAREFMQGSGWSIIDTSRGSHEGGYSEAGMTAHRGILHPDEYVDDEVLIAMIEDELGFTYEEIRSVYRQGRMSDTTRELRERIDARLLALSRSGGNIAELGRRLGFYVDENRRVCETFEAALTRAREAEGRAA